MIKQFTLPLDTVLLLGPTGSGKSPLGDYLSLHGLLGKRCHHLDFGSELRSIASGNGLSSAFSNDERSFLRVVLEEGLLLENEHFSLARKIILHALEQSGFLDGHILVLNGIPRHEGQARDISSISQIDALIVLECDAHTVQLRLRDNTGGDREGRIDDHRELVQKKLQTFTARTEPLIRHYQRNGSMIYRIPVDGRSTTSDTYRSLRSLASAYPPFSLVAEPPQG